MKRIIVLVFAAVLSGVLVLAGLLAYLRHTQTALLSKPPEHGISFVIEAQLAEAGGSTNDLAKLKETLQKRCSSLGVRIYWEPILGTRVRVVTPILSPGDAELVCRGGRLEFRLVHEESEKLLQSNEVAPGYEILQREQSRQMAGREANRSSSSKSPSGHEWSAYQTCNGHT